MIRQTAAIARLSLLSIEQRLGTAATVAIGIAVTVAVIVSVLAMTAGFDKALKGNARIDRAIVTRAGATSEIASALLREDIPTIMNAPEIRMSPDGKPIASAEAVVLVTLKQKATGTDANVTLRGVGAEVLRTRPEVKLVEGRMFHQALRELIVGRAAAVQFSGLRLGNHLSFHNADWTIVGIFEDGGDSHESELQGDVETVLSAYRRNLFQSVTVVLKSAAAFDAYKQALISNPTLKVDVKRETDYYAGRSKQLARLLNSIALCVGGVMALGAVFASVNTMHSAVSDRAREIATLRAIGFAPASVVLAVIFESLLYALAGSALGCAIAWAAFNGNAINTLGANFSQIVFHFAVTGPVLLAGAVTACVIGTIGGLLPALRATRIPIAAAFRAS